MTSSTAPPSSASWESAWPLFLPVQPSLSRYGSSLWNSQSRNWHQQYRNLETLGGYEIPDSSCYGWYFGYLRYDRGCDRQSERYNLDELVKKDGSYNYQFGYSHMASGLVCGFSCVVRGYAIVGGRICDWDRWGCWYSSQCTAIAFIRGPDPDTDFRLGVSSVRTDRVVNFGNLICEI